MNGHRKMGLTTFAEAVSRGRGRPVRMAPTARIVCICGWVARRHASTYEGAKDLCEIALRFHLEENDAVPPGEIFAW